MIQKVFYFFKFSYKDLVGFLEFGACEGITVGLKDGFKDGLSVGGTLGDFLLFSICEGVAVGLVEDLIDGFNEGERVGGFLVYGDGAAVGFCDGLIVDAGVKNDGHSAFKSFGRIFIVPFIFDGASIKYAARPASKCQSM